MAAMREVLGPFESFLFLELWMGGTEGLGGCPCERRGREYIYFSKGSIWWNLRKKIGITRTLVCCDRPPVTDPSPTRSPLSSLSPRSRFPSHSSQIRAPTAVHPPTSSRMRLGRALLLCRERSRMFVGKTRGKGGGLGMRRKGSKYVGGALRSRLGSGFNR
jgi:hypothetical protein